MTTEIIGKLVMNMDVVKSSVRPWMDKEGKVRYYINDILYMINQYREYTDTVLNSYYNWEECHASAGRVRECIESNIIPKTKAFIDEEGHVHIYGYSAVGKGVELCIPELIEKAVNLVYGYCTEEERQKRLGYIGQSGQYAKVGDTVEIVDGRKEVGKTFVIFRMSEYQYSPYREPSIYLHDKEGFKVQAHHCKIKDVGYAY